MPAQHWSRPGKVPDIRSPDHRREVRTDVVERDRLVRIVRTTPLGRRAWPIPPGTPRHTGVRYSGTESGAWVATLLSDVTAPRDATRCRGCSSERRQVTRSTVAEISPCKGNG